MTSIAESVATDLAQKLVDGAIKEVNYLCCFKTNVENFEKKKKILAAKRNRVENDIEDAKKRNDNQVEDEIQHWMEETNDLIQEDTKTKKKWFYGWCPNCIWQFQQGKRLSKKMQDISNLIHGCNFDKVARPAELPGIKYYSSQNFIDFESRKSKFKQLVEALEGGNYYKIGLQGMGGTGKTTLATQVGKKVEESKAFEKVIFVVVSNPPDIKKIRGNIARHLGLQLKEGKEEEHSEILWSRIANNEGKVLIILDDIWEELDLRDIGIPSGHDHKNCCVLITTRDLKVCEAMGCQQTIRLWTVIGKDALNLFVEHVGTRSDDSFNEFEDVAQQIVDECGGLPLAIVAVATTLKGCSLRDWKNALVTLQNSEPLHNVHKDLTKVYRSLKLSYDNLEEKAKYLFLLCSLFPEDYEIPVDLLSKLGIGLGLFGEVNNYSKVRRRVIPVKNDLIKSSLLLEAEEECVKMHDLVREVALWIADKYIQVIMDSRITLKANMRFLFWNIDDFPKQFDGTKLEILLLWVNGKVLVEVPNAFFAKMARLRVLFLLCKYYQKHLIPSLLQSLHSLKNIRTLILNGWKLGDISILGNLKSLETLELQNCLIIEVSKEMRELKKLRLLGLRECKIEMNNPFEVIEKCSQLEELYFVRNYSVKDWKLEDNRKNIDEVAQNISPPILQMYFIACSGLKYFYDEDNGLLRCINTEHVKSLISDGMFNYLVRRAQVLELGEKQGRGWKNLIPHIVPMEDGGMNDLMKLCLYYLADIECLIDSSKHLYSDVTAFSKLVELRLYRVCVKELYRGPMPLGFLQQLKILNLRGCTKLHSILFNGKFNLCNLKVMRLEYCPMLTSIFQPSTARTLGQLEELIIDECQELKYIITYERSGEDIVDDDDERSYGLFFPKLKTLQIERCGILELILPLILAGDLPLLKAVSIRECKKLKYIFGEYRDKGQALHQEIMLPSLKTIELSEVPSLINIFQECNKCMPSCMQRPSPVSKHPNSTTRAFSWAHGCCFLPTTKDTDVEVSKATLQHHTISPELPALAKWVQTFHTAQCLLRQPLNLQNIREMQLVNCSNLISLFTLSIATTIMLEKLAIHDCDELKQIITNEGEDHDHVNYGSIFPKLEELVIFGCSKLEFIFPSIFSGGLLKLKSMEITIAPELKYVFGKNHHEDYSSNENENDEFQIDLPTLEYLCLEEVPKIISICAKKCYLVWPSLQKIALENCQELNVTSFSDLMVCSQGRQLNLEIAKDLQAIDMHMQRPVTSSEAPKYVLSLHNLRVITITECKKLRAMFSASILRSLLQLTQLYISDCNELVHIVEEDYEDHGHINCSSIFPKLEKLEIRRCNKLEFIFPSTFSGGLEKLKSIAITYARELKYVFGKYHLEDFLSDENENDELHIDLPALEYLHLENVPKIISICAKKCYLTWPSLQEIALQNCQELNIRSFSNLILCSHEGQLNLETAKDSMKTIVHVQNLTSLEVGNSKIEEIFNLEGVDIEGPVTLSLQFMSLQNLSELRLICKGPKYILSLHNLWKLEITACEKLRAIFSASTLKSLPKLSYLKVTNCKELVHINEEDYEESADDHLHQLCFPKLEKIHIKCCNSLKCLFSILTPSMLPKLESLEIEEASELEQVFTRKQSDTHKRGVEDVFPNLYFLTLKKLPRLVTICEGIDFRTVEQHIVVDCPQYQGMHSERVTHSNSDLDSNSEIQAATEELLSAHSNTDQAMPHMGEAKSKQEIETQKLTSVSPNLAVNSKEAMKKIIDVPISEISATVPSSSNYVSTRGLNTEETFMEIVINDPTPTLEKQALDISSAESELRNELEDEQFVSEPTLLDQQRELGQMKTAIDIPQKMNIPFDDDSIDVMVKERFQEGPTSEDVMVATLLADLAPRNSSMALITPLQEFSLDVMTKESRSETIMTPQLALREKIPVSIIESIPEYTTTKKAKIVTSSIHSQPGGGSRPGLSTPSYKEIGKEVIRVIPDSKLLDATTLPDFEVIKMASPSPLYVPPHEKPAHHLVDEQQPMTELNLIDQQHPLGEAKNEIKIPCKTNVTQSIKETVQQGLQEHDTPEEAMIAIQSNNSKSRKQSRVPLVNPLAKEFAQSFKEIGKEVVGVVLASELSMTATSPNLEVTQTIKETMEQGLQENYAIKEAIITILSTNSDSRKQSTGPLVNLSEKESAITIKETTDLSVQEGPKLEKSIEANLTYSQCYSPNPTEGNAVLADIIPSLYYQSQIGAASPSTSILGICEIFQLVELKDGEPALLAKALEQYPQLRLPRQQRTPRIIAFSYRVLVDILVTLATKTPYTITASDKLTLEANLGEAIILGFNKDWVESIQAKVFGIDMSNVLATKEEILVMEADLQTCDIALDHIQKQKVEVKKQLEAIDSKLFILLEDRKKLVTKMTEFREIISAKDRPFGF